MLNSISALVAMPLLVVFLSAADMALGRSGLLPAGATTCALAGFLPLALVQSAHQLPPPSVRRNTYPLAALCALALMALAFSALPGATWDEGGKWIFLLPYAFLTALLATAAANNRLMTKVLPVALALSLALLLWSICRDLTAPGTFTPVTERSAGFSGNANYTALVTAFLCAAALDYERTRPLLFDLVFIVLSLAIVLISLSRSGLVVLGLLLTAYAAVRITRRRLSVSEAKSAILSLMAAVALLLVLLPVFAPHLSALQEQTRFRRALAGRQIDDGSAASRLAAAQDALNRINDSPIVGHGTGYARRMPELPHNLYLQQWVNNGLLGLVGYLAFLGISAASFLRRRFFPGLMLMLVAAVGSFFSHNVLDQRPFLILYGLLLGLSSAPRCQPRQSKVGS